MSLRGLILSTYEETVALAQIPEELKRALKTHERVPKFINSLEREFSLLPESFRTTLKVKLMVTDFTNLFLRTVTRHADERAMSDLEKIRLIEEQAKKDRINEAVDSGIITEQVLHDIQG